MEAVVVRAPYLRDELCRMGLLCETFETCTTWSHFPKLDEAGAGSSADGAGRDLWYRLVTCRFTHLYPDGPAPYYTVIAQGTPGQQVGPVGRDKGCGVDGTCRKRSNDYPPPRRRKRPSLVLFTSGDLLAIAMLRAAKTAVDPTGIMNWDAASGRTSRLPTLSPRLSPEFPRSRTSHIRAMAERRSRFDDDKLMAECDVDLFVASGPAASIATKPKALSGSPTARSGIVVAATERRSQIQNRIVALARLREKLES